jgi:uncharacterized Tic20 family protein
MTNQSNFPYQPGEHEAESASNSYLMSLVAVMAGLPLPIVNLLATFFFFVANRKKTFFVRWHCTQALLSQLSLFFMNSVGFWWTISIMFFDKSVTNNYIGYMIVIFFFNVAEFIATIYTAVKTRNGKHVEWFFYGDLTNMICKA